MTAAEWHTNIIIVCKKHDYSIKEFCMHTRIAITGKRVGVPLFESMEILGVKECLRRLDKYFGVEI